MAEQEQFGGPALRNENLRPSVPAPRETAFFRLAALSIGLVSLPAFGQVSVLTHHNDNSRSGTNLKETVLTTSNVNVDSFGKLFTAGVDGYIFAQPLYVPKLNIAGGTHNVVYAATAADSIFAFDADTGSPLWSKNYGTPVPSSVIGTENILVQVGIISTPVIDPSTQTMYAVTKTYENQTQIFRLHALDITSGSEKFGGPVQISAVVNGTGDGNDGAGHVPFQASKQNQRAAVTLANGVVYLAFGSHEDYPPYHGWVLAYSASTLQQLYVFNSTSNGAGGGIWQSGQGPVVDANNNLYLMIGNGTTDVQTGGSAYSEAFVKLSSSLVALDYFVPGNFDALNSEDEDVGSGGPVAIPGTSLIAGEGKQGALYVVNTANMGHYNASGDAVSQEFSAGPGVWGAPIFWNNPNSPALFVWNNADYLKAFPMSNGVLQTTPAAESSVSITAGSVAGALSISSNQYATGTNILWASVPLQDSDHNTVGGQLYAFDAANIANELWDSRQNAARDDVGNWAKFVPPTVANGKVYMATDSGQLVVYGLINSGQNATVVDDSVMGSGVNQFNYVGAWGHCQNCGTTLYDQSNSWDNTAGDYVTVAFTGTQIQFRGVQDTLHGIGAVSIDGGSETNIDFYASARAGNVLLWSSPVLVSGNHTFKLRATGTRNSLSTNTFVVPDRVDIIAGSSTPAGPTGLKATAQSNSVVLSWNAVSGAQYYAVYRGTAPGGESPEPFASPAAATYSDNNVVGETTYYYTVAAVSSAGTSAPSNEAFATPGSAPLPNGTYVVTNKAGTLVWDDSGFSRSRGTNVILWPANGGTNQQWTFTSIGNGYYTIANKYSGLLLDDPGFSTVSGQKLVQWPSNGGKNQHWSVTNTGSGYVITNQSSGLVVDPSTDTKGTAIVQATGSGQPTQVWLIH